MSFFSVLPSSSRIVPQNTNNPLGGVFVYNLILSNTDVIAPWTDYLLTRSLMFVALPYSSDNNFLTSLRDFLGGIIKEITEVPLPFDSISFFINLLILNYSTVTRTSSTSSIVSIFLKVV